MGYRIINGRAYPVGNFQNLPTEKIVPNSTNNSNNSFKEVLDKAISSKQAYKISKHAALRLEEINFNDADMKAIEKGFKIAESKAAKNSVIFYKDVALIASIENRTVITAIEKERAKDNIFTNIDSVVVL